MHGLRCRRGSVSGSLVLGIWKPGFWLCRHGVDFLTPSGLSGRLRFQLILSLALRALEIWHLRGSVEGVYSFLKMRALRFFVYIFVFLMLNCMLKSS